MADTKHGLALFPGGKSYVEERVTSIRRRCGELGAAQEGQSVRMLCLPGDVDELEMSYMLANLRLPKRVMARMRKTS